ncbi:MAG TPA: hypothetical protein VIJ86_03505 [Acidimicrobiales bacterium]
MTTHRRRHHIDRIKALVVLVFTVALTSATALHSPLAVAANSSSVMTVADYAFLTANHARPPHAVTAADVANAVATELRIGSTLTLGFNVDDVMNYPRLALFVSAATFKEICVDFPATVGRAPMVVSCPIQALTQWQLLPSLMNQSRYAVAAAAAKGRAVSGADVVRFLKNGDYTFLHAPSFREGQGGVVTFTMKMTLNSMSTTTRVCIHYPKTEAGIPVQVLCK